MKIGGDSHFYRIGDKVAENSQYRLYLCTQAETERQCLLQIPTAIEFNGKLSRVAYILDELKQCAEKLETEYAENPENSGKVLNYALGFPELVDSFISREQGGRLINVFAFRSVENVQDIIPLINITAKDRLRVDLRTSVWIMGKTLKLLDFTHDAEIAVNSTRGNNILIEKDNRYVVIFDWIAAQTYSGMVPMEMRRQDISHAAQAVVIALGGDWKIGILPNDGEEAFSEYTAYLLRLARGSESKAQRAHQQFYEIVDKFWKREFYPFTTKPL